MYVVCMNKAITILYVSQIKHHTINIKYSLFYVIKSQKVKIVQHYNPHYKYIKYSAYVLTVSIKRKH